MRRGLLVGAALLVAIALVGVVAIVVSFASGAGAPATAPTPTATGDGWPDASTTGVPAGVKLTKADPFVITEDGATVDGLDVQGDLTVQANDVTITNTRVNGRIDTSEGTYTGIVIQDVEVIGPGDATVDGGYAAIGFSGFSCIRCNVHGWGKGFALVRNATIKDSWVHDMPVFGDPANGGSHNEAVISLGGSNFTITGNRFDSGSEPNFSAALALYNDLEPIVDVLVEGNLFNGGGYCLYAGSAGDKPATNTRFIDNTFGTEVFADCGAFGPVTAYSPLNGNEWTGNVFQGTGKTVPPA